MKGHTHLAAGTATGLFISAYLSLPITGAVIVTGCSALSSLIPDIDNATSKVGRRVAPASFLIQLFIGHRTIFHAPALYLILSIVIANINTTGLPLGLAFGAGAATHLLLDLLNPAGIPLLWPAVKRFRIAHFRSGGLVDWILGITLWGACTAILLYQLRV